MPTTRSTVNPYTQTSRTSGGTSTQTGQTTNTQMPVELPGYESLGDLLRARARQRLMGSVDLSGYEAQGIQNINQALRGTQTALDASLTSRGLANSPIAGNAQTQFQMARGGNIAEFLNSLPLLQRQMQAEDFALANQFYQSRPMGATTTSDTTQTTTTAPTETTTTSGEQVSTVDVDGDGLPETLAEIAGLTGGGLDFLSKIPGINKIPGIARPAVQTAVNTAVPAAAIPALTGGLTTAGATGLGTVPLTSAAVAQGAGLGVTSGAPASVAYTGGAGAGGGSAVTALLTNPITIAIGGTILGVTALLKSQAHHEANSWVQGFQNPFDREMDKLNRQFHDLASSGQLTREQALQIRQAAQEIANAYEAKRVEFASRGSDEAEVAGNAKRTADRWYGPGFSKFLGAMDDIIGGLS